MRFLALDLMENPLTRATISTRGLRDAVIVAFQLIWVECSDSRHPAPIRCILGNFITHTLTRVADGNPLDTPQLRPLALKIFTLVGGMWFDPQTGTISSGDKAHIVEAIGDVPVEH